MRPIIAGPARRQQSAAPSVEEPQPRPRTKHQPVNGNNGINEEPVEISDAELARTLNSQQLGPRNRTQPRRYISDSNGDQKIKPRSGRRTGGGSRQGKRRSRAQKQPRKSRIQAVEENDDDLVKPVIEIGKHEHQAEFGFKTSVEHPCEKIFVCEFCLDNYDDETAYKEHCAGCPLRSPPGNIIFLDRSPGLVTLTVYEIDGQNHEAYCSRLEVLSKFFVDPGIDHDEPLTSRFYILCIRGQSGDHIVGYFSKPKVFNTIRYNLNMLLVFPQFRKLGYGHFLIGFSYLLSTIVDKAPGTPRFRTLELMEVYRSYMKQALFHFWRDVNPTLPVEIDLPAISAATGISKNDIEILLLEMKCVKLVETTPGPGWQLSMTAKQYRDSLVSFVNSREHPMRRVLPNCLLLTPVAQLKIQDKDSDEDEDGVLRKE